MRPTAGPVVGVDVGGTFTDVVLVHETVTTAKVPTTDDQHEGVLAGIERACEAAGVDPADLTGFAHAMTVSVNALLEGTGATTALVTTAGFRDVLEIGRQARPALYDLDAEKPDPLVPRRRRFELPERATTEGIAEAVDPDAVRELAADLPDDVEAVAVAFLHAYAHPANERAAAAVLREALDVPVSASHETLAEFREYERTATTVADAYLTPAIDDYVGRVEAGARERGIPEPRVMQANGGVTDAGTVRDHAVSTVLSGPAAGVVGATAATEGRDLVTFDMGGTSSDVSLVRDGEVARTTDAEIAGHPVRVPMVEVETVGAGGGSIARVDEGGALRVGPASAGATPGPVCYGRGGTRPTVTDADLVLGYLGASTRLGADLTLDAEAARAALADLADDAGLADATEAARGVHRVTNATMARAMRAVTVERGHDPREFGLVAFGGAGPMHAAALAADLGIERVVVPRACGVLSAYGLLAADETRDAVRTHRTPLGAADTDAVEGVFADLEADVLDDLSDPDAASLSQVAECRYAGQSFELAVPVEEFDPEAVRERFHDAHEAAYGYRMDDPVELVNCRVTGCIERAAPELEYEPDGDPLTGHREAVFAERRETPVFDREALAVDRRLDGPAIVEGPESTVVVPPDWTAEVQVDGTLEVVR